MGSREWGVEMGEAEEAEEVKEAEEAHYPLLFALKPGNREVNPLRG